MGEQLIIVATVTFVVILRRFSPIAGAIVAMISAVGIGTWGHLSYEAGRQLALIRLPLSPSLFFIFIGLWLMLECWNLQRGFLLRKKKKAYENLRSDPSNQATTDNVP